MTTPWEHASPDQPIFEMLPARSTHDRDYVLYLVDDVTRAYELVNERTGEKQEIGGQGGLYMVMDIAEAIVCERTGNTPHDRNMVKGGLKNEECDDCFGRGETHLQCGCSQCQVPTQCPTCKGTGKA